LLVPRPVIDIFGLKNALVLVKLVDDINIMNDVQDKGNDLGNQ
jgi:hypothetical protein